MAKVKLSKGQEVEINKLKVRHIKKVAFLASKLKDIPFATEGEDIKVFDIGAGIADIIENNFDELVELLSGCTSLTTEEFEELELEPDFLKVVEKFIEVNKDFFTKIVATLK